MDDLYRARRRRRCSRLAAPCPLLSDLLERGGFDFCVLVVRQALATEFAVLGAHHKVEHHLGVTVVDQRRRAAHAFLPGSGPVSDIRQIFLLLYNTAPRQDNHAATCVQVLIRYFLYLMWYFSTIILNHFYFIIRVLSFKFHLTLLLIFILFRGQKIFIFLLQLYFMPHWSWLVVIFTFQLILILLIIFRSDYTCVLKSNWLLLLSLLTLQKHHSRGELRRVCCHGCY